VVKASEDTDVEETLLRDTKVGHDIPFGDIIKGWFGCQEVNGDHELVDARVEEGVGRAVDCMDVGFRMMLEVDQLWDVTQLQTKSENAPRTDHTHLSPRQIWSDDKLDVPMAENMKNHAPEIPLVKT
jgi:hypothetical protein